MTVIYARNKIQHTSKMNTSVYCSNQTYTKNFIYGSGASVLGPYSRACQIFAALNPHMPIPTTDPYLPGVDILNRPVQQNITQAHVRNQAIIKYMLDVPGCRLYRETIDPQNIQIPPIVSWRSGTDMQCEPILTLTDQQIVTYLAGRDPLLTTLVTQMPLFNDILDNIHATLRAQHIWSKLQGSKFYEIYSHKP